MRDALQIYDKILSSKDNEISLSTVMEGLNIVYNQVYFELFDMIVSNKIPELLVLTNSILSKGIQGDLLISGLGTFFRDLLVSKDNKSIGLFNSDKETSSNHSVEYFIECINITNTCDINFSKSINQNLLIELTFMKLASLNYNDEKKSLITK